MISGVVLAAGTSSRYGSAKLLLPLHGKALVQHVVDAAAAVLDEIVVVVGHEGDRVRAAVTLPPGGRFVDNPRYAEGQASSLAAGLAACSSRSEAAVVLLADQPGIEPEIVIALVDAFGASRTQVVRARFRDGPGPALLSREVWGHAMHLHGDSGARELIASHPDWVEEVAFDADQPPDVDVPADYERITGSSS